MYSYLLRLCLKDRGCSFVFPRGRCVFRLTTACKFNNPHLKFCENILFNCNSKIQQSDFVHPKRAHEHKMYTQNHKAAIRFIRPLSRTLFCIW